jgi:hypothetical protein
MENNGNIPHQQRSMLSLSTNHNAQETQATTSNNVNNAAFVNHGMVWAPRLLQLFHLLVFGCREKGPDVFSL